MDRSYLRVTLVLLGSLTAACDTVTDLSLDGGSNADDRETDAGRDSSMPPDDDDDDEDGGGPDAGAADSGIPAGNCDDSIRNGSETDVDCGGDCDACELGDRCKVAEDCLSGYCGLKSCRAAGLYAFDDGYAPGIVYSPYLESMGTVVVDNAEHYVGTASLRMDVPASGYNGASLQAPAADLKDYDALVFWAKASAAKTVDVVGFGADGAGDTSRVQRRALALTTTWTRFIVPIPNPSIMSATVDHFSFAEGSEEGTYSVWFDEIRFARLAEQLGTAQAELQGGPASLAPDAEFTVTPPVLSYTVDGAEFSVEAGPRHFDFASSDEMVATIDAEGKGKALAEGQAEITASLRGVQLTGSRLLTVASVGATVPSTAAPTPTKLAANVLSLFSDAYTDLTVDTFSAGWDSADVSDETVTADAVKRYTNLVYAGIEFTSAPIDASSMDTLHLDVWTPDAASLSVKLVDFGANGTYQGGDDSEHAVTINEASAPTPLSTGAWVSLDLPMSSFAGLAARAHLAQLVFSGATAGNGPAIVFLDNLYFYRSTAPSSAAPAPTQLAANVKSLFSDAYTDLAVGTFSAEWDSADVSDETAGGDAVKRYTNLVYAGIEFTSPTVDASMMDTLHLDVWTPDAALIKIKLVDFGANGAYQGGDDSEHELTINGSSTPTPLSTGSWVSLDLPLSSFAALAASGHLAQLVFSAADAGNGPATVFLDNLYFYDAP